MQELFEVYLESSTKSISIKGSKYGGLKGYKDYIMIMKKALGHVWCTFLKQILWKSDIFENVWLKNNEKVWIHVRNYLLVRMRGW